MNKRLILISFVLISVLSMVIAVSFGTVVIPLDQTWSVIMNKIFNTELDMAITDNTVSIIASLRLPRVLLAFVSGALLSLSGVMMQSVLKNPLASSFTLGVSSGAALGASIAIMLGISIFGTYTLTVFGLTGAIITVFLSLAVAKKVDKNLKNNSVILTGMAFSLFANAIITIIMTISRESLQRIIYWQMGTFSIRQPEYLTIQSILLVVSLIVLIRKSSTLDVLTLGDEEAYVSGVNVQKEKIGLLTFGAFITGIVVSMVGIIGFVDLFTPHIARKIFGASHKYVIVASALLGGIFIVLCDLAARTITPPMELPVGAITAAFGGPMFIYIYFSKRKEA